MDITQTERDRAHAYITSRLESDGSRKAKATLNLDDYCRELGTTYDDLCAALASPDPFSFRDDVVTHLTYISGYLVDLASAGRITALKLLSAPPFNRRYEVDVAPMQQGNPELVGYWRMVLGLDPHPGKPKGEDDHGEFFNHPIPNSTQKSTLPN